MNICLLNVLCFFHIGIAGFYLGWLPALVQKIPSYALTWMFFQQFKAAFSTWVGRAGTALENLLLGSFAAAGACCVMIPVDTIKTRIVTQGRSGAHRQYTGMMHCLETVYSAYFIYNINILYNMRICVLVYNNARS